MLRFERNGHDGEAMRRYLSARPIRAARWLPPLVFFAAIIITTPPIESQPPLGAVDPVYGPEVRGRLIGLTTPSRQATLAAVMSARIARIHKMEGATIREGEVLVELNDAVQRARVSLAQASADSSLAVDLARAERDRAQNELKRLEALHDDSSASSKELFDARSLALMRQLELDLAVFNQAQAMRTLERERALLEDHHLRAPFAGFVVEHLKHEGETVDPLEGIVSLVGLDPLRVTVDCPLEYLAHIERGAPAGVAPIGIDRAPRVGRVTYISPVVDGGSQTVRVKVDVDNEDGAWMAGMKVAISFTDAAHAQARLTGHNPGSAKAKDAVDPQQLLELP